MPETASVILGKYLSSDGISVLYKCSEIGRSLMNGLSTALSYSTSMAFRIAASALHMLGIQINLDLARSSDISKADLHMENWVSYTSLRYRVGLRMHTLGYQISL